MLRAFDTVFGHYFRLSFTTQRRNGLYKFASHARMLFLLSTFLFLSFITFLRDGVLCTEILHILFNVHYYDRGVFLF